MKNGILINNTMDEWLGAFQELINNSQLRKSIAKEAYYDIVKNYHISGPANKFLNLIS